MGTALVAALVAVLIGAACGSSDATDDVAPPTGATDASVDGQPLVAADPTVPSDAQSTAGATAPLASIAGWYRPPVGATWQWQLSGEIDTSYDVDVYDIDLFDAPARLIADLGARGVSVICYFSAGSAEDWRGDVSGLSDAVLGEPLDDWEGERWLDIRSREVLDLMVARLDLAAAKGCDGVEPDNVQAYGADSGFPLSAADQVAFNVALAAAAHERGLAIALKNAAELIPELIDHFDFSVNEECHEFDECAPYAAFVAAGKPVLNAEYRGEWVDDERARAELCARAAASGLRTLVLPLELDGSFRFACDG